MLALVFRIILLFPSFIVALKDPVFTAFGFALSWKDIILIGGGAFLIWKAVGHIHDEVEEDAVSEAKIAAPKAFNLVIGQIVLIDLVFSVDSIITAVGLADHVEVAVAAVVIAVGVSVAAGPVSHRAPPTTAGAGLAADRRALVADGLVRIPRGHIYTAIPRPASRRSTSSSGARRTGR
jgi:hypothetical protein